MDATLDGRCRSGVDADDRIAGSGSRRFAGGLRRSGSSLGIALALVAWTVTPVVASAAAVEQDARDILRSMSDYLGGLPAFSVDVDVDNELVDLQGQKLHHSSSASLIVQRPDDIYAHRRSGAGEAELLFDGKVATIRSVDPNVYVQVDTPGDIDQALRNVGIETGLDFPGADLLYSDPYDRLMYGVESGAYLGSGYVNGLECHHLAFRSATVDWQIWIQTGDTPLPMKYVITTKWVTAAPQYVVRLRNWDTKPKIQATQFEFSPATGAKKLDSVPVSATGDLIAEGK